MEPDCAFYVGERARGYYAASGESDAAVIAFVERVAPDLVVEVEITHADEGKAERYADIGVRELWHLRGSKHSREFRAEFLALRPGAAPRTLEASQVLDGLTPADAREAVSTVQSTQTLSERTEAVARIVNRRRQASVRVREEEASYAAGRESDCMARGGSTRGVVHDSPGS